MQTSTVPAPKKKKKWLIVIGIVTLIAIVASINIAVMQKKETTSAQELQFGTIEEQTLSSTKLVTGEVKLSSTETLYADATKGKVKDIFVKQGDDVVKGQKLFSYENAELELQVKQAELQQKTTNLQYEQVKEKIAALKKEIQTAKNSGAGSEVVSPLESQLKELELQQKTTELTIEEQKLQKKQLDEKRAELTVYSTIDGRVQTLDKDAAQVAAASAAAAQPKVFIQLASKEPYRVEGTLTELQKAQVKPDQVVKVTSKAVPNQTWTGKVIEVSDYPTTGQSGDATAMGGSQNISYYSFKAVLDTQENLSPGYHVSLEIELASGTKLAAPRTSVMDEGEEKFLYLVVDGKLQRQSVKTGMSAGEWVEITEGVAAGQQVLTNPSGAEQDGMEVTVP